MRNIKQIIILGIIFLTQSASRQAAEVNNMFGFWGSITLRGGFKTLSPKLENLDWLIINQTRTRDDSPEGSRFTENIFQSIGLSIKGQSNQRGQS